MQNQSLTDYSLERMTLEKRYNNSRNNLLFVVIFSVINIVLLTWNSFTYFLFSATVPYMLADLGKFFCGKYPLTYYDGIEVDEFLPEAVYWVMLAIAAVIIVMYLLAYLFSKKNRVGWLIFALIFFVLDTVTMFLYFGISADMIMDIVFHIWVLVSLGLGIHAHFKLKKLPCDSEFETYEAVQNSPTEL